MGGYGQKGSWEAWHEVKAVSSGFRSCLPFCMVDSSAVWPQGLHDEYVASDPCTQNHLTGRAHAHFSRANTTAHHPHISSVGTPHWLLTK